MKKKPSLKDIAERLDVSTTLVSMALNGKGEENRISEEKVQEVFEVAEELNYRPNQLARGLRTGHSKTLGLIVGDISNPFFANIGRKIEDEAGKNGYHVIFCSCDESKEKSQVLINVLKERQVDGLIIVPAAGSEDQIKNLQDLDIPLVLLDRYFPEIKTNYIVVDNYRISFNLVSSLLEKGHRRIGSMFFNPELIHMQRRIEGYKDAFRKKGIPFKDEWVRNVDFENLSESIEEEIQYLVSRDLNCDALFLSTGELAVHAIKSLMKIDPDLPKEIGICCFDDPEAFHFSSFSIETTPQPIQEMGEQAVKILLQEINQQGTKKKSSEITL